MPIYQQRVFLADTQVILIQFIFPNIELKTKENALITCERVKTKKVTPSFAFMLSKLINQRLS